MVLDFWARSEGAMSLRFFAESFEDIWQYWQYYIILYSLAFLRFKHFQARIAQKAEENISQGATEAQPTETTGFMMSSLLPLLLYSAVLLTMHAHCVVCPYRLQNHSFFCRIVCSSQHGVDILFSHFFTLLGKNWQTKAFALVMDICWCTCGQLKLAELCAGSRRSRCM